MKNHGRTSVAELLGDFIVYRSLTPADQRLPGLAELHAQAGLPAAVIPRKSEPEYARIIVLLLQQARALTAPAATIRRLLYLGDTELNDGTALVNICRAGSWPGIAFIGSEKDAPAQVELVDKEQGSSLYLANRWSALADFDRHCRQQGAIDEQTAVIIDLDKTTLGARGRNDHLIDRARIEAVHRTVNELLGDAFDAQAFKADYDRLNQVELHPFTTDNQDYLAYICLVLGSGLHAISSLLTEIRSGRLSSFTHFITEIDQRRSELPTDLVAIHREIFARVQEHDPTPFKAFRRNEYRVTVELMGCADDQTPAAQLLDQEIVITQEVREAVLAWQAQGALIFGLSDKPDEASTPAPELAAQGFQPIHQVPTHSIG